jgi:inhibitor of cysteine peptidase
MRLRLSALLTVAALGFALSPLACAGSEDDAGNDNVSTPSEEGSAEDELRGLSVTDADNGKTVTATEGQNLLVKLQSNPSTGYGWTVVSTDRTFGYPSATKFFPNGGGVGSGGLERFTWKTKNGPLTMVGSHTVKMEYKRSWETNVAPAKTFTFTVKIVSGSCPQLVPPAPGFCSNGMVKPRKDASGCTTGYECVNDCRANACSNGRSCQMCWGSFACIPNGALCWAALLLRSDLI